ncbi:unnamed protein product [Urochloa humidicola]
MLKEQGHFVAHFLNVPAQLPSSTLSRMWALLCCPISRPPDAATSPLWASTLAAVSSAGAVAHAAEIEGAAPSRPDKKERSTAKESMVVAGRGMWPSSGL